MFERIKKVLFGAPRAYPEPKRPVPIVRPLHEVPPPSAANDQKVDVAEVGIAQEIQRLEAEIASLEQQLVMAQNHLQSWVNAESSLHFNASVERAENQASVHGFVGTLLGPKFREGSRDLAISQDAVIVKKTLLKHREIAAKKAAAEQHVMHLQSRIVRAVQLLGMKKATVFTQQSAVGSQSKSIDLLHKLKEAHDLGLLTDAEYEEKRARLARDI